MNMSLRHVFTLLLAAITTLGAPICHAENSQDAEAARSTIAAMERAWNTHDMDAFANLFAEDADFVNIEGTRWRSRSAIKEAHTFVHTTIFKQSHLTVDDTTIRQLSPDVIVTRSTWHLAGQTTMKGEPVPGRSGILTNVLVRSGPRWMIAVAQNTDIVQ
ncbi:SgcJ/EcaC family oxidoreductase [Dyella amyloliquefaciens]|uniref:SgcJ/EcaC family oxidoreductase n=1 Tax=Dyella amyloliquefaciens TaxID=1770545 RepID=UPI00102E3E58|nr:SgcJ/EcaC family oxidoreductase [Dyella amyloliquefaciens]